MTYFQPRNADDTVVYLDPASDDGWGRAIGGAFDGGGGNIQLVNGAGGLSYRAVYESQLWVHVTVNKLARGLSRLPGKAYERETRGDGRKRLRPESHSFAQLMAAPYEGGSPYSFWNRVFSNAAVHGKGLVLPVEPEPGAEPTELLPLEWEHLTPYRSRGVVTKYKWRRGDVERWIYPEDIMTFGHWGGVSPLKPLAETISLEDAVRRQTLSSFKNGARPSGVITSDMKKLDDGQLRHIEEQIASTHQGVDNAFRVAILAGLGDVKWEPLQFNTDEMATIDLMKVTREEACAALDIAPPIVHILDRATFSNISEQQRMHFVNSCGPWTTMAEQELEAQMIRRYPRWRNCFYEFDYGEILRGDPVQRANSYAKMIYSGWALNDIRRMENLPPVDHPLADTPWMPRNLIPVKGDDPVTAATATAEAMPVDDGMSEDDVRSLLTQMLAEAEAGSD